MSYSVYYWTAGTKFVGRAFPIILLEHAKQSMNFESLPTELPNDALPTFAPLQYNQKELRFGNCRCACMSLVRNCVLS